MKLAPLAPEPADTVLRRAREALGGECPMPDDVCADCGYRCTGATADALSHAITTASNDDDTLPGTPERARHVDRLDALDAAREEIGRLQAEVASLRLILGGRTFSATVPEPIGCPLPGACAQVAEIMRLRGLLRDAVEQKPHWRRKAREGLAE